MVFVSKTGESEKIEGFPIREVYKRGLTPSGIIGLEIEVEGRGLVTTPVDGWTIHEDHSLRGAENREYVFDGPVSYDEALQRVDRLFRAFDEKKTKFDDSNRTSVHVHLNVNDFYADRLAALLGLWFIFEDILVNWCGEYRVGNLFCLRAKDAPNIVTILEGYLRSNLKLRLPDRLHYSALNANAIEKFGSLEIRSLRGTQEQAVILRWLETLMRIYTLSEAYSDDPRRVCQDFSTFGAMDFLNRTLGPNGADIIEQLGWQEDRVTQSLWEGMRISQDLVFSVDWSKFKRQEVKIDPFGRSDKKTARVPIIEGETIGQRIARLERETIRPIEEEAIRFREMVAPRPRAARRRTARDVDRELRDLQMVEPVEPEVNDWWEPHRNEEEGGF